jgi:hypothetical protein
MERPASDRRLVTQRWLLLLLFGQPRYSSFRRYVPARNALRQAVFPIAACTLVPWRHRSVRQPRCGGRLSPGFGRANAERSGTSATGLRRNGPERSWGRRVDHHASGRRWSFSHSFSLPGVLILLRSRPRLRWSPTAADVALRAPILIGWIGAITRSCRTTMQTLRLPARRRMVEFPLHLKLLPGVPFPPSPPLSLCRVAAARVLRRLLLRFASFTGSADPCSAKGRLAAPVA